MIDLFSFLVTDLETWRNGSRHYVMLGKNHHDIQLCVKNITYFISSSTLLFKEQTKNTIDSQ